MANLQINTCSQNNSALPYRRIRLHIGPMYRNNEASADISSYIAGMHGVIQSKANPITGNLLIIYNESLTNELNVKRQLYSYVKKNYLKREANIVPAENLSFKKELKNTPSAERYVPGSDKSIPYHTMNADEIEKAFSTDIRHGLQSRDAQLALKELGLNILSEKRRTSLIARFFENLRDFSSRLLLGVGVISFMLGQIPDAIAILGIVGIQTILDTLQQYKAEKSLHSLKDILVHKAKVVRNGNEQVIEAKYLVPGDVIIVEAGDKIPADARIIDCYEFRTTEASLTGEAAPVFKSPEICRKNTDLGSRHNMLYMGTNALSGKAKAIVVATGMKTEIGKIAAMLQNIKMEATPLENKITAFTNKLTKLAFVLGLLTAGIGLLRGITLAEAVMMSISFSIGAIPESLPAVMGAAMALSVQRMATKNAIVRKLPAVEALGSADVICCDKTGTLTMNEMTVRKIYVDNSFYGISGVGYDPEGGISLQQGSPGSGEALEKLLKASVLCNNSCLINADNKWVIQGDPTEGALLTAAYKYGIRSDALEEYCIRKKEIPFDSSRRYMTVLIKEPEGEFAYCKGSFSKLSEKCKSIYDNGQERLFSATDKERLQAICDRLGEQAYRVLAFGYKKVRHNLKNLENNFVFLGLMAMEDPPRKGVKVAIQKCRRAGIKVVMITGDNKNTAAAIGHKLGLLTDGLVISGTELEEMTDSELLSKIDRVQVFARTSPEQKYRIVKAFKQAGHIVTMTGDGVNDAPAIKEANIGIAMGKNGSDIAKDVACITLVDDNFLTIVSAIEEGRTVTRNIKNTIKYLLAGSFGEILAIALSSALCGFSPLLSIQLLWVNIISETIMGSSLAVEKPAANVMNQSPYEKDLPLVDASIRGQILRRGVGIGLATFGVFKGTLLLGGSLTKARTLALSALVLAQLSNIYDCRSNKSLRQNRYMNIAAATSSMLLAAIVYMPFLSGFFGTVPISPLDFPALLAAAGLSKI